MRIVIIKLCNIIKTTTNHSRDTSKYDKHMELNILIDFTLFQKRIVTFGVKT